MRVLWVAVFAGMAAWAEKACSPSMTNGDCQVEINATQSVSPLPIRVWPGKTVTVNVQKKPVETVSLELEVKESDTPDPLAAILQMLIPRIEKFVWGIEFVNFSFVEGSAEFAKLTEFEKLAARAKNLIVLMQTEYDSLWNFLNEDKDGQKGARVRLNELRKYPGAGNCEMSRFVDDHLQPFFEATKDDEATHALKNGRALDEIMSAAAAEFRRLLSQPRIGEADLARYRRALDELETSRTLINERHKLAREQLSAVYEARRILKKNETTMRCSQPKTIAPYAGRHIGQTAVAKVMLTDSITETKRQIATVTVIWGSTKWEASVGVAISGLVDPAFAFTPTLSANGGEVTASKTFTLTRTAKYPAIVPLALAHFRLAEFTCGVRRCALLASGGLGVNPSSSSADVFAGGSFSFRNAVFSVLLQMGRVNALPAGLSVGNTAASAIAIPANRAWDQKVAIGVTVRLPIN